MSTSSIGLLDYYQQFDVSIWKGSSYYNSHPPYHPDSLYPEYPFKDLSGSLNPAYEGVRESLHLLGLDRENYGQIGWNPLGNLIQPGSRVIIKPNFVLSSHTQGGDLYSIITHPSVIRAVVDYVYLALRGEGEIIIADAPQMDCNFTELLKCTQLQTIKTYYWAKHNFDVQIVDLRSFWLSKSLGEGEALVNNRIPLPGDPLGQVQVNLGAKSAFIGKIAGSKIYGADYNRDETIKHHHDDVHEYQISKTFLSADVVISLPKLKVHKKVGVTLNAKGLVGINTNKNQLVHYTLGTPSDGGDQYPDNLLSLREGFLITSQRMLYDVLLAKKVLVLDRVYQAIRSLYRRTVKPWFGSVSSEKIILDGGNWYGNDTAWRMVADLVHIALYADEHGSIQETPQRKIFSIIDGIVGGDNNGPLVPDAHPCGLLIAGFHPIAVDLVGSRLMGFNWRKVRILAELTKSRKVFNPPSDTQKAISIRSNQVEWQSLFADSEIANFHFLPHPGWKGHVEID